MKQLLVTAFSGMLFAIGLSASGMIDPNKVLAFLTLNQHWDPSLMLVMAGTLTVTFVSFAIANKQAAPLLEKHYFLPTRTDIDWKLLVGTGLFGVGWGMTGYCPGPAVASLGLLNSDAWLMVGSILAGRVLHDRLLKS